MRKLEKKKLKAHKVKQLPEGTIIYLRDDWTGHETAYQIIRYGREKRLKSLERSNVYLRIKEIPGATFYQEGTT